MRTVFTEYVDVMNIVSDRNRRQKWTAAEIATLRREIAQMKANEVDMFSAYHQKSEMGTVKWHMLDHVADGIIKMVVCISNTRILFSKRHSKELQSEYAQIWTSQ